MAVFKFRSVEDVPAVAPAAGPAENLRAAFDLSALSLRLARRSPAPGVRRYASIDLASKEGAPPR